MLPSFHNLIWRFLKKFFLSPFGDCKLTHKVFKVQDHRHQSLLGKLQTIPSEPMFGPHYCANAGSNLTSRTSVISNDMVPELDHATS